MRIKIGIIHPRVGYESTLKGKFETYSSETGWLAKSFELGNAFSVLFESHLVRKQRYQEIREKDPNFLSIDENELFWATCLLLGISLENIAKAKIIHDNKDKTLAEVRREKGKIWEGHKIRKLMGAAKVELNEEEALLCDIGEYAILAEGRFPIPNSFEKFKEIDDLPVTSEQTLENLLRRVSDLIMPKNP